MTALLLVVFALSVVALPEVLCRMAGASFWEQIVEILREMRNNGTR